MQPTLYTLHLQINHKKPNFSGTLEIQLPHYPPTFSLTLHASKLVLTKCILRCPERDIPLSVEYDRPNQTVTLSADSCPPNGFVVINYMGQLNAIQTYQDHTYGMFKTNYSDQVSGRSDNYIIATHFQPFGARLCFPLVDEIASKVPIKLRIETLSKFKVASVGKLLSVKTVDYSENSIFDFEQTPPIAPSVFGFVMGDFEQAKGEKGPASVLVPIGESQKAAYTLELIDTFLPILETLFGAYPLEKMDFVALPFLSDGAMENWGLVSVLQDQLLLGRPQVFQERLQLQQLVAHELVHQWVGNLVSFDEFQLLWLNEALATWVGNYVIYKSGINDGISDYRYEIEDDFEGLLDRDCLVSSPIKSIYAHMSGLRISHDSTTAAVFDNDAYEKGIALVRMMARSVGVDTFFSSLGNVVKNHKYGTIKAFDIWNEINKHTPIDMQSFSHSWTRYAGYPLVKVSLKENTLYLEQHTYLQKHDPKDLGLEDAPYHVPLNIKCGDKILPLVMTDRSMELDVDQLVCLNSNRAGYYRVEYTTPIIEQCILPAIGNNKLSPIELISIINDTGKVNQKNLLLIISALGSSEWTLDFFVLRVALKWLEKINLVMLHFSDYQFGQYLTTVCDALFHKVGGWDQAFSKEYSSAEMEARNSLLQLGIDGSAQQKVAKTYFKKLFAHDGFFPKELASATFNLTIRNAPQKEYKKILELVRNANVSMLSHTNMSSRELQTVALSSLGFVSDPALLHKSLNFVKTNIDSKMIELGLVGFLFTNDKQRKLQLWQWYKVNYDLWIKTSLRNGQWSEQLASTMRNVSSMVLGDVMNGDKELCEMREAFVKEKLVSLPEHGLGKLWGVLGEEGEEKKRRANEVSEKQYE